MESIVLLLTKFPDELLSIQLALLCFFSATGIYLHLIRRYKRMKEDWVPAAIVREHLDKIRTEERTMRARLFGEEYAGAGGAPTVVTQTVVQKDPALEAELAAVRAQLSSADTKSAEFEKLKASWATEKASLEQKIQDAAKAAPAPAAGGAPSEAQTKEIADLKAKLSEYEVIEDDLANLKKYQLENKMLKDKLMQLEGGPSGATAAAPAPAPEPAPAPVAEAPKAEEPKPAEAAPAPAPEKKDKEQELLNEFEKMLAS